MKSTEAAGRKLVTTRQGQYKATFDLRNPNNQAVLEDLAIFCGFSHQPPPTTPEAALIREARREVFMRILTHLELSPRQLYAIATGQPVRALTRAEKQALTEVQNDNGEDS